LLSVALNKLKNGLKKTRNSVLEKFKEIFLENDTDKETYLEKLEEILILSDIGQTLTHEIISKLRKQNDNDYFSLIYRIKEILLKLLIIPEERNIHNNELNVTILVGVNGAGKTTSIGKLANFYNELGRKVLIVPADTFRAAANEQLMKWSERSKVEIFHSNSSDPSAVIFESLKYAKSNNFNEILIDTAGRLQTKANLMNELSKIQNVVLKFVPAKYLSVVLVLDATAGQNGINQAIEFNNYIKLNGIIITKLDGTAKGGIVFQIVNKLKIPILFIGVGESISDLLPFNITDFVNSFFSEENE
jgi:fused signal recognition particle receptor